MIAQSSSETSCFAMIMPPCMIDRQQSTSHTVRRSKVVERKHDNYDYGLRGSQSILMRINTYVCRTTFDSITVYWDRVDN